MLRLLPGGLTGVELLGPLALHGDWFLCGSGPEVDDEVAYRVPLRNEVGVHWEAVDRPVPVGDRIPDPDLDVVVLEELGRPGLPDDPYIVTDRDELQAVDGDVGTRYELGADVDAYYPHCVPGSGRLFTPVNGLTLEL